MAETKLGSQTVHTSGELPRIGSTAPDFQLTARNLSDVTLKDFRGSNLVLNIFPSIDTSVCATSVREFNKRAASLPNVRVLCVAKDLPFAFKKFCAAEGISNVEVLSDFRHYGFGNDYGVELTDGAFKGLLARAIVVIGADGVVRHTELVASIDNEPNYDAALSAAQSKPNNKNGV